MREAQGRSRTRTGAGLRLHDTARERAASRRCSATRRDLIVIHNMGSPAPIARCGPTASTASTTISRAARPSWCPARTPRRRRRNSPTPAAGASGWSATPISTFAADMGYRTEDGGWLPGILRPSARMPAASCVSQTRRAAPTTTSARCGTCSIFSPRGPRAGSRSTAVRSTTIAAPPTAVYGALTEPHIPVRTPCSPTDAQRI